MTFAVIGARLRPWLRDFPGCGYLWGREDRSLPPGERCRLWGWSRTGSPVNVTGGSWQEVWDRLPGWLRPEVA